MGPVFQTQLTPSPFFMLFGTRWREDVVLLPRVTNKGDVSGAHLILTVMDWDFHSADDLIGHAIIPLTTIFNDNAGGPFNRHPHPKKMLLPP